MNIEKITAQVSVSDQIVVDDLQTLADTGIEIIVCNRPDGEASNQTPFAEIEAAAIALGIQAELIAFSTPRISSEHRDQFVALMNSGKRLHAYCRTGSRSKKIWSAANDTSIKQDQPTSKTQSVFADAKFDVVIVGAGSAGIATASSIRKRDKNIRIALIDPSGEHYYQPGWTMVGGGVFDAKTTCRKTKDLIPDGVNWIQSAVASFVPSDKHVVLQGGEQVFYKHLVVAPGLKLDWSAIEGLEEALGKNGVTSNYRYDLAPYTWKLVQNLKKGRALFTQPPMPIKCAGAPQKALYLSGSEWFSQNRISDIDIEFYNSGGVLFGVEAYVPALMKYIEKYQADLKFMHTLVKVDGPSQTAWFKRAGENASDELVESKFDILHVCPPQCAPDFIRQSDLSDDAGWLDVNQATLQHTQYSNIWGVGDVMNTPNAKTMAAARKQAPIVAQNICNTLAGHADLKEYDGYGSCPLTVEKGKIVLAEFGYGGKLLPSFPKWFNDGTKPTSFSWFLKASLLPVFYWRCMLKAREWMI